MELVSAIILGLLGSIHCLGMCGPLALALPHKETDKLSLTTDAAVYNAGRILTYAILGYLLGWLGVSVRMAGFQQGLSIAVGVVILLGVSMPAILSHYRLAASFPNRIFNVFRGVFASLLKQQGRGSLFSLGLLNGLLPCGLVYAALGASITTGDAVQSSFYMALFGFGTFPMMLSVSFFGAMASMDWRKRMARIVPASLVAVSLLLILRGLSLGIPYVSPVLSKGEVLHDDCCSPAH